MELGKPLAIKITKNRFEILQGWSLRTIISSLPKLYVAYFYSVSRSLLWIMGQLETKGLRNCQHYLFLSGILYILLFDLYLTIILLQHLYIAIES